MFRDEGNEIFYYKIYGDKLFFLIEIESYNKAKVATKLNNIQSKFIRQINDTYGITLLTEMGVYFIKDNYINIKKCIEKSRIARVFCKRYNLNLCFYYKKIEKKLSNEKKMIPIYLNAKENNRVKIYLQPKINVLTNKIVGAEALVRLFDEDNNMIMPNKVIPILEENGLIQDLDLLVLQLVNDTINDWINNSTIPVPISINLSRTDFNDKLFYIEFINSLNSIISPIFIEFEITETAFFENYKLLSDRIGEIQNKGFRINIDDFGSGYNSLITLHNNYIDTIKFDQQFTVNCTKDKKGQLILKTLINMFKSLNINVVCEGVETLEEKEIVESCGCEVIQGYYYGKPMSTDEFYKTYLL